MGSLADFLKKFFLNKGHHVFVSLLIAKICAFLGALFIIRILPESEFGTTSIAASVFAVFAPFSGFGSQQSLLRFGSVINDISEKKSLSRYLFLKGFGYQVLLAFIFLGISFFYIRKYEDILLMFLFFAVRLIGFYFFNHIQSELRILGNNREFARVNNVVNISGVVLLLVLSFFFGLKGYLFAIAITPFLSLFWYKKENRSSDAENFSFAQKEIWNYGLHAAGTALLSDMLFSADVLLLSFLMDETAVANYKTALLIPSNITFLALTFLQTDFPVIAGNYQNKEYLKNYIFNYYKIFIPITVIIFGTSCIFSREILTLFFGSRYQDNTYIFVILSGAFCLNMLFRNLYGNMLSAVGVMKANTTVSTLAILLLVILSLIIVPEYGINGMAFSMALSLIFTGFATMFYFIRYIRKLK
ncbi:MAG: oligosaccharide flippase family protein [Bergeyella sp.]